MPSLIRKRVSKSGKVTYLTSLPIPGEKGKTKNKTWPSLKAAKAHVAEWRLAREAKTPEARVTVSQAIEAYLDTAQHSLRPTTLESNTAILRRYVLPTLGDYYLDQLTPAILQGMINSLAARGLTRSVGHTRTIFGLVLEHAISLGQLETNPIRKVKVPRSRPKESRTFSPEDLRHIFNRGDTTRYGTLYRLLAYTGLRPSEACGLLWEHVDLNAGKLRVEQTITFSSRRRKTPPVITPPKSHAGKRTIPLPDILVSCLGGLRELQEIEKRNNPEYIDQGFVFAHPDGKPYNPANVSNSFSRMLKELGINSGATLYSFRHTYASRLISQKVSIKLVSRLLGHADIVMTLKHYAHIIPEDLEGVTEALNGLA